MMARLSVILAVIALIVLYFAGQRRNPPGFYVDESSIALNALLIARTGADEYGVRLPLYFVAFGEAKNPTYIYLLSGLFSIVEPGTLAARRLSAFMGICAVLLVGYLGWRVTRSQAIALLLLASAAATPILFEISRLVFEVAFFPFTVAAFLIAARVAFERDRWGVGVVVTLAITLAAITYTYTAGRFLGPMFAVLLALFATRKRLFALVCVWMLYATLLFPAVLFNTQTNGALFRRMRTVSSADTSLVRVLYRIGRNLDPVGMSLRGDPEPRHHVPRSGGSILMMTFVLAALGAALTLPDRWTQFLLAGTLLSVVPAAITPDMFHTLRLSAYPVFLLALSIPALQNPSPIVRRVVAVVMFVGALQAIYFFVQFHRLGGARHASFDAGIRRLTNEALDTGMRPIYVLPGPVYAHVQWFGALRGVDRRELPKVAALRSPLPKGALAIMDSRPPDGVAVVSQHGRYSAVIVP